MCLAVPGKILNIDKGESLLRSGEAEFGGVNRKVNLACVPEAEVGNYVLVHAGLAISVIDEEEAHKIFATLKEMADAEEKEAGNEQT